MEVSPVFLFLLCGLCVSLAVDLGLVDANYLDDDAADYKDPCKAGTVHFASSKNLPFWEILLWMKKTSACSNRPRPLKVHSTVSRKTEQTQESKQE